MAKIDNVRMQVELNPQDRRVIRDLTRAIDRLTRSIRPYEVRGNLKRLAEPSKDPAEEIEEDLEPGEAQLRRPWNFESPQEAINRLYG